MGRIAKSDEYGQSESGDTGGPPPAAVRAQLDLILTSANFDASERNRRFLGYIVEQTLAGRGARIKAYDIALAVFGRDDSFDPQTDPIIRIEASRLRRSLERYYLMSGRTDPLRISIPKGHYVAAFELMDATVPPPDDAVESNPACANPITEVPVRRTTRGWQAAGLLACMGLVGWGAGWQAWGGRDAASVSVADDPPTLAVAPFKDLSLEPAGHIADGIAQEVLAGLYRFKEFVVLDARGSEEPHRAIVADYLVSGSVRHDSHRLRVSSQLMLPETGAIVWSATYDEEMTVDRLYEIQDGIAANIAATVAQPYGVIYRDARERLQRQRPADLSGYECLLEAYAYRRAVAAAPHAEVRQCLEEVVAREPFDVDTLAMLAMIHVDEFRFGFNPREGTVDPLAQAVALARRAVEQSPDSAIAWFALFEAKFFQGNLPQAFEAGEQAMELNPHNPEYKAMVGMRLAHAGQWDRGIDLVQEALLLNPAPPGWYYFALGVEAYRRADDEAALAWAQLIEMPDLFWTHLLLAAVYAQLGRADEAAAAVDRLLTLKPNFAERSRQALATQHFEPALLDRVVEGLRKAGLAVPPAT